MSQKVIGTIMLRYCIIMLCIDGGPSQFCRMPAVITMMVLILPDGSVTLCLVTSEGEF